MKIYNLEVMAYFSSPSKNIHIKIKYGLVTIFKKRSKHLVQTKCLMDKEIKRQIFVLLKAVQQINGIIGSRT